MILITTFSFFQVCAIYLPLIAQTLIQRSYLTSLATPKFFFFRQYYNFISTPNVSIFGLSSRLHLSNGNSRNKISTLTVYSSYYVRYSDRIRSFERYCYRDFEPKKNSLTSTTFPTHCIDFISTAKVETYMSGLMRKYPFKILFLSADTGGGHRASAESLANQFMVHFPNSTYELLDIWTRTKVYPYRNMIYFYKYLCAHPKQWKLVYHISNNCPYIFLTYLHSKFSCFRKIVNYIHEHDPDVVVSVHPTMNYIPLRATREVAISRGKYIPFFTVVTDYGSGHCTWFDNGVDKIYVASERLRSLAKRRANIPKEKIVMNGLPIRHDFVVQSMRMGNRMSVIGKSYRQIIMQSLYINPTKKMILIMGGGEGVGFLERYAESLYVAFIEDGVDATICIVCGRNDILRNAIQKKNWENLPTIKNIDKKRLIFQKRSKVICKNKRFNDIPSNMIKNCKELKSGNVDVIGIGFVTNIAEYMVAADILLSKAGPGTIAEATALGLPIIVTSFLPGQEAGNVNVVLDGGFGSFCEDPSIVAKTVVSWLKNDSLLKSMSEKSSRIGNPEAASVIARDIGYITSRCLKRNKNEISK